MVATSYLLGVSTQRVDKLVEQLGITGISKSQVSQMAKVLDEQVEAFRTRALDGGPYAFVWLDALTQKVREGGRIVNVHIGDLIDMPDVDAPQQFGVAYERPQALVQRPGERPGECSQQHRAFAVGSAGQMPGPVQGDDGLSGPRATGDPVSSGRCAVRGWSICSTSWRSTRPCGESRSSCPCSRPPSLPGAREGWPAAGPHGAAGARGRADLHQTRKTTGVRRTVPEG